MTERDKESRLATKAQVGERMRTFLADPIIKGWFDKAIADHTEAIINADVLEDDKRRSHAVIVKTLKELWRFMEHADAEGRRSGEELSKRNKQKVIS